MEIPTLPKKERQKMFTQMWVGQMYGAIGFIMEKQGPQGWEEYNQRAAKQSAEQFKAMGKDDSMGGVHPRFFVGFLTIKQDQLNVHSIVYYAECNASIVIKQKTIYRQFLQLSEKKQGISMKS